MKLLLPLMALALASGCATMNKEECQLADWQAVGYKHGSLGQSARKFDQYQSDCADHSIKADYSAFKRGHQLGLDDYCVYQTGLQLGSSGSNYNGLCKASRYEDFEDGYHAGLLRYCTYENGYDLGASGSAPNRNCAETAFPAFSQGHVSGQARYALLQSIGAVEDELASIEQGLQQHADFIADSEALIISRDSSAEDRAQALLDIKTHRDARKQLKRDYKRAQAELAALRAQLNAL